MPLYSHRRTVGPAVSTVANDRERSEKDEELGEEWSGLFSPLLSSPVFVLLSRFSFSFLSSVR